MGAGDACGKNANVPGAVEVALALSVYRGVGTEKEPDFRVTEVTCPTGG